MTCAVWSCCSDNCTQKEQEKMLYSLKIEVSLCFALSYAIFIFTSDMWCWSWKGDIWNRAICTLYSSNWDRCCWWKQPAVYLLWTSYLCRIILSEGCDHWFNFYQFCVRHCLPQAPECHLPVSSTLCFQVDRWSTLTTRNIETCWKFKETQIDMFVM